MLRRYFDGFAHVSHDELLRLDVTLLIRKGGVKRITKMKHKLDTAVR